jgi:hypothetical protein
MGALKGRYSPTRGNAPGAWAAKSFPALKGRNSVRACVHTGRPGIGFRPFRARTVFGAGRPGRCPGLTNGCAFGAANRRPEGAGFGPARRIGVAVVDWVLPFQGANRFRGGTPRAMPWVNEWLRLRRGQSTPRRGGIHQPGATPRGREPQKHPRPEGAGFGPARRIGVAVVDWVLPFQGAKRFFCALVPVLPRALPWASELCPVGAGVWDLGFVWDFGFRASDFSGGVALPRAVPWADELRPVGADEWVRR